MSILAKYGLNTYLDKIGQEQSLDNNLARVLSEHSGKLDIITETGIASAVTSKTFRSQHKPDAWPKVGDWIELEPMQKGITRKIIKVLPRFSVIKRSKPIGHDRSTELPSQTLAANVDVALVVWGLDGQPDLPRVKRFIVACEGIPKVYLILNKTDLKTAPELRDLIAYFEGINPKESIIFVSNKEQYGIEKIQAVLKPGQTGVLLGPSGSGKSSLINTLLEVASQKVGQVRESDKKGKHTTTRRQLLLLPSGACIIDTPGLREFEQNATSRYRQNILNSRQTKLFKKRKAKLREKDLESYE